VFFGGNLRYFNGLGAEHAANGENSGSLTRGKPMAKRRRGDLPDGFCRIVRLISTA
jgi:hypothetical protein